MDDTASVFGYNPITSMYQYVPKVYRVRVYFTTRVCVCNELFQRTDHACLCNFVLKILGMNFSLTMEVYFWLVTRRII